MSINRWQRSLPRRKSILPEPSDRRAAMADFLLAAAGFVLTIVALGLVRVLYGPAAADRIMSAQLLGTGGIAALLLLAEGMRVPAGVDIALVLALLAAFVSVAFAKGAVHSEHDGDEPRAQSIGRSGRLRRAHSSSSQGPPGCCGFRMRLAACTR
jgi:multicomponent Na+:H+ antiporter subunit F